MFSQQAFCSETVNTPVSRVERYPQKLYARTFVQNRDTRDRVRAQRIYYFNPIKIEAQTGPFVDAFRSLNIVSAIEICNSLQFNEL